MSNEIQLIKKYFWLKYFKSRNKFEKISRKNFGLKELLVQKNVGLENFMVNKNAGSKML